MHAAPLIDRRSSRGGVGGQRKDPSYHRRWKRNAGWCWCLTGNVARLARSTESGRDIVLTVKNKIQNEETSVAECKAPRRTRTAARASIWLHSSSSPSVASLRRRPVRRSRPQLGKLLDSRYFDRPCGQCHPTHSFSAAWRYGKPTTRRQSCAGLQVGMD